MTSLHDLRFNSPPNSKVRLRLRIKPCAICIPHTGRCILVLLAHLHEQLLTTRRVDSRGGRGGPDPPKDRHWGVQRVKDPPNKNEHVCYLS